MLVLVVLVVYQGVALHPEGVDRNYTAGVYGWNSDVALHPEGVDRNNDEH